MLAQLRQRVERRAEAVIWRLLSPHLESILTDRLLAFYEGLLEREQISRPNPIGSRSELFRGDAANSSEGQAIELGRVLPFAGLQHRETPHD